MTYNDKVVYDNVRKAYIIADIYENSHQITMAANSAADDNVNKRVRWLELQSTKINTSELTTEMR